MADRESHRGNGETGAKTRRKSTKTKSRPIAIGRGQSILPELTEARCNHIKSYRPFLTNEEVSMLCDFMSGISYVLGLKQAF